MAKVQQEKVATRRLRGEFQGITLQRSETGALTVDVSSLGSVDVTVITTEDSVVKQTLAEEQTNEPDFINTVDKQAYSIGDVLPDGWILGPVSPTTGKPMSMEPVSGTLKYYRTWEDGEEHAKTLRDQGHANARQPDENELEALNSDVVKAGRNQNAQLITMNTMNGYDRPDDRYWSSLTRGNMSAQFHDLEDNKQFWAYKRDHEAYVRCVRDEPDFLNIPENQ